MASSSSPPLVLRNPAPVPLGLLHPPDALPVGLVPDLLEHCAQILGAPPR
jgi:hypothetical protein